MLHCVYASSGKTKQKQNNKKKKKHRQQQKTKVIKEPDAKCIYLFIHSVPPPSSRLQRGEKKAVREAEGGVTGQKKILQEVVRGSWRLNTHSFTWHSSLSSLRTHTASALRSSRCVLCVLAHQSKSKDKAKKKKKVDTKGQKIK